MIASSILRWVEGGKVKAVIEGERKVVDRPVAPYFFIRDLDAVIADVDKEKCVIQVVPTDLKTATTKEEVLRIDCESPDVVGSLRRKLDQLDLKTYEADISYSRRVFVDKCFEVRYGPENIMFIDVELDDSHGFKAYGEMPFLSVAFRKMSWNRTKFYHVSDFSSESEMLWTLLKEIEDGVSVLVGWNVEFDYQHLAQRYRKLEGGKGLRLVRHTLGLCYTYDMREEYRSMVKGLVSYSLDEVATAEGLGGKVKREGKVSDLSKRELEEYNLRDVELLLELEEKYGFLRRDIYLCSEVNLPMEYAKVAGVLGDSLVLRRLRELGYVAPNVVKRKKRSYTGALVLEPKPGLYTNVVAVDVVSLYPTVILDRNIDILDFGGQVLPHLVGYFFRRKLEEEERGNKAGRETYKLLANSIYGLLGYEGFRFFDENKAEMVTRTGREVLTRIKREFEDLGFQVLYGDTDSCFVKVEGVENLTALIDYINEQIKPYRISLDMVFDKIIFFGSEKGGVKKRYIGVSGDKWKVRGLELRRGDWSLFSKNVIWDVVKIIFNGGDRRAVEEYLKRVKRELFSGKRDDELMLVKRVRPSGKYKSVPAHYKLYLEGVRKGLIPLGSTEVAFYYKAGPRGGGLFLGLWAEPEKRFDYATYWEKQVMAPVRRIIDSVFGKGQDNLKLDVFDQKRVDVLNCPSTNNVSVKRHG
jgi:DNA polymerase elongation subunit (family B)